MREDQTNIFLRFLLLVLSSNAQLLGLNYFVVGCVDLLAKCKWYSEHAVSKS